MTSEHPAPSMYRCMHGVGLTFSCPECGFEMYEPDQWIHPVLPDVREQIVREAIADARAHGRSWG